MINYADSLYYQEVASIIRDARHCDTCHPKYKALFFFIVGLEINMDIKVRVNSQGQHMMNLRMFKALVVLWEYFHYRSKKRPSGTKHPSVHGICMTEAI